VPTYGQLNQTNPCVDRARNNELRALYEGGRRIESLFGSFLPKRPREREERYQVRLKDAEYRNYVGPIADFFAAMLFVSRPVIKAKRGKEDAKLADYWNELREDCDGGGTDIDAFFKDLLLDAMQTKTGWLRVRAPDSNGDDPGDMLEFEKRGLGQCWLEDMEDCSVLDWDTADDGRLIWAITHERSAKRTSLSSGRDTITETWEYLTPEAVEVYQITYQKDQQPKPEDEVSRIAGPLPHRFGAVPLVCLDLSPGLWVLERLRSPQVAHLKKQSALNWSLASTAYAMPVAKVGSPDDFQKNMAGAGYEIVIQREDSWEWEAPPTAHFTAIADEVKTSKDEIFRIAHQMALGVENNAAAIGRSGQSKATDMENTRVVLGAYSRVVKETIEYTLDLIATARGEKDLEFSVEGLDDFAALDATKFLDQLAILKDKVGALPSRTFWVEANKRAAGAVLRDLDEDTVQRINDEIERDTTDPAEDAQAERDAFLIATRGTVPPGGVGNGTSAAAPAPAAPPNSGGGKPKGGKVNAGGNAGAGGRPAASPR
jgi:hypothetical protein